jgi:hypothetical protein
MKVNTKAIITEVKYLVCECGGEMIKYIETIMPIGVSTWPPKYRCVSCNRIVASQEDYPKLTYRDFNTFFKEYFDDFMSKKNNK